MAIKNAIYALAVAVLMGTMAVAALADYSWEAGAVKPDSSVTVKPEQDMEPSAAGEIREPIETGSVPDRMEGSSDQYKEDVGEAPLVEFGGETFRPSVDSGP